MLNRPSARRSHLSGPLTLNLVPMLDAMVTLIAFMLYTASFIALVSIDTPVPSFAPTTLINQEPLQLTLTISSTGVTLWSPFKRIDTYTIPNLGDGTIDLATLHAKAVSVKQRFSAETKIILVPAAGTSYDELIGVMDTIRDFEKTDPTITVKDSQSGIDQVVPRLFPEIIFGNLGGAR